MAWILEHFFAPIPVKHRGQASADSKVALKDAEDDELCVDSKPQSKRERVVEDDADDSEAAE